MKTFIGITILLIIVLILEALGIFNQLNVAVYYSTKGKSSPFWKVASLSANLIVSIFIIVILVSIDYAKEKRISTNSSVLVVSFILCMLLVLMLKLIFHIKRPNNSLIINNDTLAQIENLAFPSGHAARASLIATYLVKRFRKIWPLWIFYVLIVCISRVILHTHWLSDVIAGTLIGLWSFLLCDILLQKKLGK